jgi:nicotinate-nucleotide pyrophosphorylase
MTADNPEALTQHYTEDHGLSLEGSRRHLHDSARMEKEFLRSLSAANIVRQIFSGRLAYSDSRKTLPRARRIQR